MDMHQPVRPFFILQMALRQIHAEQRVTGAHVIQQLRGHKLSNILLRLFSRTAHVRRQNHVGQPAQHTLKNRA